MQLSDAERSSKMTTATAGVHRLVPLLAWLFFSTSPPALPCLSLPPCSASPRPGWGRSTDELQGAEAVHHLKVYVFYWTQRDENGVHRPRHPTQKPPSAAAAGRQQQIIRKQPTLGRRQLPLPQVTRNKYHPSHVASPPKNSIQQDCKIHLSKTGR